MMLSGYKVVILCGGSGTRLREQTEFIPKPLIPIGGKPMVHHIMSHYSHYGVKSFVLALGYKQEAFKEYFINMRSLNSNLTISGGRDARIMYHDAHRDEDDWTITLVDAGANTLKGGRLKRVASFLDGGAPFFLTYGDAVSDVDLEKLMDFHRSHGKMVTITGVHPEPRFGELCHHEGMITQYSEKPSQQSIINGGFMVMNPQIMDYLTDKEGCDLELGLFPRLADEGELAVYEHNGFWKCMDTLKEMDELRTLWEAKGGGFVR